MKLLKGIVEKDDVVWNDLLDYQSEIQDYISVMGLELIVKKDEGFAFVKQMKLDEDKTLNMVSVSYTHLEQQRNQSICFGYI